GTPPRARVTSYATCAPPTPPGTGTDLLAGCLDRAGPIRTGTGEAMAGTRRRTYCPGPYPHLLSEVPHVGFLHRPGTSSSRVPSGSLPTPGRKAGVPRVAKHHAAVDPCAGRDTPLRARAPRPPRPVPRAEGRHVVRGQLHRPHGPVDEPGQHPCRQ